MSAVNALAGLICGVLSGFGIGGGSLLLIYMTSAGGLEQVAAQGINLVYFLPASSAALVSHWRRGFVERRALLWAAIPGMAMSALAALAATSLDSSLLHRLFGIFCVIVGVKMFFGK